MWGLYSDNFSTQTNTIMMKMLTKTQANKLRGRLTYLLELCDEHSHAGSLPPDESQYIREEFRRVKRDFLDEILNLTKDAK